MLIALGRLEQNDPSPKRICVRYQKPMSKMNVLSLLFLAMGCCRSARKQGNAHFLGQA